MKKRDRTQTKPDLPLNGDHLEWGVSALSSIIVFAMMAFLGQQALKQDKAVPDPMAVVTTIETVSQGYRVEFDARNAGEATAAAVTFRADLMRDGQTIETADITFDYLPGKSKREGAVLFQADPRRFTLMIRAESFKSP